LYKFSAPEVVKVLSHILSPPLPISLYLSPLSLSLPLSPSPTSREGGGERWGDIEKGGRGGDR